MFILKTCLISNCSFSFIFSFSLNDMLDRYFLILDHSSSVCMCSARAGQQFRFSVVSIFMFIFLFYCACVFLHFSFSDLMVHGKQMHFLIIYKNNMFINMFPYEAHMFLIFVKSISVINKGSEGRYLVIFGEIPKRSNKLLKCGRLNLPFGNNIHP